MKLKHWAIWIILLLLTLLCVADGVLDPRKTDDEAVKPGTLSLDDEKGSIEETPVPTPCPTPEPVPETQDNRLRDTNAAAGLFTEYALAYSALAENPAYGLYTDGEEPVFSDILADRELYARFAEELTANAEAACLYAAGAIQDVYTDTSFDYRIETDALNWKYAGAMLWLLPETVSPFDFYTVTISLAEEDAADLYTQRVTLTAELTVKPFFPSLYALCGENRDAYMAADYIMAYLTTVYDDEGEETDYVMPSLTEAYIQNIGKPLKGRPVFYDRWYQGRSKKTRKHTGLDLHARKNAHIYSCTDGTVLYVGYRDTPGYYVVIRDPYGYEYHYYHMSKASDFLTEGQTVTAGEMIGYVGNTGNSDLNHLHLGLITPEGYFVRLYDIMRSLYRGR